MDWGKVLARARVPLGWALGLAALATASPTPAGLAAGLVVAGLGELVRLWAAGHLVKNRALATTGPYARTRNPLYLGTLFVGSGFAVATGRLPWLVVFLLSFVAVYVPVMKREASRLASSFPAYREYASRVPLFVPRLGSSISQERTGEASFSWRRVRANGEHVTLLGWVAVTVVLSARLWAKS